MRTPLILLATSATALLLTGCINNAVVEEPDVIDNAETALNDAADKMDEMADDAKDTMDTAVDLTEEELADMAEKMEDAADTVADDVDDAVDAVVDLGEETATAASPTDTPALLAKYSPENVKAAHDAGKNVIALVSADWCGTCQATKKALMANASDLPNNLTILDVNFDKDAFVKDNNIKMQHTAVIIDADGNVKEILPGAISNANDAKTVAAKYFANTAEAPAKKGETAKLAPSVLVAPALLSKYSDANVRAAHAASNDVIALVSADWCATCQATKKALMANASDLPNNLTILDVNFDKDAFVKDNNIKMQHTAVIIDKYGNVKEILPGAISNANDAKTVAAKYFK